MRRVINVRLSKTPATPYGDIYIKPQPKYNEIIVSVYDTAVYANALDVENLVLSLTSEHKDRIIRLPVKCIIVTPQGIGAVLHCGCGCSRRCEGFLDKPKFKKFQIYCDLIYKRYDESKNYMNLLQTYEELQETLKTIKNDLEDLIELLERCANKYNLPPNPFDEFLIGRCADYPVFDSDKD